MERDSDIDGILASYLDDDMIVSQGAGRLPRRFPNTRTPRTVQPSEPRLQDTVLPSEDYQQRLVTNNSRATSEITSTEVGSSATATGAEAQQLITPQNVPQPLRNTGMMNIENVSEPPAEVMDTFQLLPESRHTGVELSGATTSEGEGFAADGGTMGSTDSLPPSPEGHWADANLSNDRIDPERGLSCSEDDPSIPDLVAADTIIMSSPNSLLSSPEGHQANINQSGGRIDSRRRLSSLEADSFVPDLSLTLPRPPNDNQVDLSVGNAETNPADTPLPSSTSGNQAAIDGVGANPNTSSSQNPPVSRRIRNSDRESLKKVQNDREDLDSRLPSLLESNPEGKKVYEETKKRREEKHTENEVIRTTPSNASSADQGILDGVDADLSGDGNDLERWLSEVDLPVTDMAAADSHDSTQSPQQPHSVPANHQVDSGLDNAETISVNTPSLSSSSEADFEGVGTNPISIGVPNHPSSIRADSVNSDPESVKNGRESLASFTKQDIINMAARDYDLERLKKGLTPNKYNQKIYKWEELEHQIVWHQHSLMVPEIDYYGEDWAVLYALQLWSFHFLRGENKEPFPPGYRTLNDQTKEQIKKRSVQARYSWRSSFAHHRGDHTLMRDDGGDS